MQYPEREYPAVEYTPLPAPPPYVPPADWTRGRAPARPVARTMDMDAVWFLAPERDGLPVPALLGHTGHPGKSGVFRWVRRACAALFSR